jgi:hypothetical protein
MRMAKRWLLFILFWACASPAGADLRYVTRFDTRTLPTASTPNPIVGLIGAMLRGRLPVGTTATTVSERGVRIEFSQETSAVPAGSIVLMRNGAVTVLNPAAMTYWTLSPDALALSTAFAADVTVSPTGETSLASGLRVERKTFTRTIDLPLPRGLQLPPDMPRSLTIDGEIWVTDQYREYAALIAAAGNAAVSALGIGALSADGFVVRQITRHAQLGYEMELTISDVEEIAASPELFEIPQGFTEVPMPQGFPQQP